MFFFFPIPSGVMISRPCRTSHTSSPFSAIPRHLYLDDALCRVYSVWDRFDNDLPASVSSHIRLFADDCLLYRTINAQHDTVILQQDLNMLQQWEAKWLMSFNPGKCEVLRVTNKRKHTLHTHDTRYMTGSSTQLTKLNT